MKKIYLTIVAVISFFIFTSNVSAISVELISSKFHVWGDGYLYVSDPDNPPPPTGSRIKYEYSYDIKAPSPLVYSIDVSAPDHERIEANSRADFFNVSAYAHAGPDSLFAAYAGGEWIFRPVYDTDKIEINYGIENTAWGGVKGEFTDLTDGTQLWDVDATGVHYDPNRGGLPEDAYLNLFNEKGHTDIIEHDFQTDHLYKLNFIVDVESSELDLTLVRIGAVDLKRVPEPNTMLFLGSGLIGLWGLRRKFKK